jgi:AraC-like DNA-binding protein
MLWIELIRLGADAGWRPAQIQLEGVRPRYAKSLAALAAERVRFEQADTALAIPRSLLSMPLPALQPDRASPLAPAVGDPLPDLDFTGSARQAVAALLLIGSPHVEAAARAAGTSVRSLQRHLATAHLSFFALLEEARCDAAQRMLRDPSTKVIEISAELGYTDSANFTRAFRRWTGLSPRAFRRSVVGCDLTH